MRISLSDAEWKLMNRLWDSAPKTIMMLTGELREETGWTKSTVITMLSRLEAKGAVRFEEGERAKQYYPRFKREDATMEETESFLSKVYGGSIGLMVNAMMNAKALSSEEIDELRAILRKAGEGDA